MPGLKGRLALRVSDGHSDRHVTRFSTGLQFTKVAPGGYQDMTFTMNLPRNAFDDLGPVDRAYLYDARTGGTVLDGYLENPTPTDGPYGQQFEVRAVGGMALASDESRALIYVTRDLGDFEKATDSATSANVEAGSQLAGTDNAGVLVSFPSGSLVATGAFASAGNYAMQRAGMEVGAIHAVLVGGKSDANWAQDLVNVSGTIATAALTAGPAGLDLYVGGGTGSDLIPPGTDRFAFRLRRTGAATNVADENTALQIGSISILGRRMNRYGTLLTGAAGIGTAASVLASQVVEDLLGRLLTFCDPATAVVDVTAWPIDQLAFPDGAKGAEVLATLGNWETDFDHGIGATNGNGLHDFWYRAWTTEPRYEVSVKDGWVQQGSDVDLCNQVLVSWTDEAGKTQVEKVNAADGDVDLAGKGLPVDALGARVKEADPVTLPPEVSSFANARRIGGQILADAINPPKAGQVRVRRPIIDRVTGGRVMPWELEPGWPCRVRETGDDLRVTQASYDDDSVAMTLTLGTPVLTREQRIARLDAA